MHDCNVVTEFLQCNCWTREYDDTDKMTIDNSCTFNGIHKMVTQILI